MRRVLSYLIEEADTGKRVDLFLRSRGFSHHILTQLKRTDSGLLLNGSRCLVSALLQKGDLLTVTLEEPVPSQNVLPVFLPLSMVYEDEDLCVLDKPAGMPVHPSINNHENTLANGLAWYFKEQNLPYVCRFINRLDRDTTGILIAAKHALSASILSDMLKKQGNPPGISGSCQRKDSDVRHHFRSHRPPARLCLKAVRGLFAWRKSRHPLYYPGLPAGSIRKWVLPDFSLSRNRAHPSDTCSYEFYWTSASWRFSLLPG